MFMGFFGKKPKNVFNASVIFERFLTSNAKFSFVTKIRVCTSLVCTVGHWLAGHGRPVPSLHNRHQLNTLVLFFIDAEQSMGSYVNIDYMESTQYINKYYFDTC